MNCMNDHCLGLCAVQQFYHCAAAASGCHVPFYVNRFYCKLASHLVSPALWRYSRVEGRSASLSSPPPFPACSLHTQSTYTIHHTPLSFYDLSYAPVERVEPCLALLLFFFKFWFIGLSSSFHVLLK
jgi:hypothetical protein